MYYVVSIGMTPAVDLVDGSGRTVVDPKVPAISGRTSLCGERWTDRANRNNA